MKKLFNNKIKIIVAIVFFVFVVPFLIHWAFKTPAFCNFLVPKWCAGDVLSFYGAILASIATVLGVFFSIDYAKSNYQQDIKDQVRPFLIITRLRTKSNYNPLRDMPAELLEEPEKQEFVPQSLQYDEFVVDQLAITIGEGAIKFQYELDEPTMRLIAQKGFYSEHHGKGLTMLHQSGMMYFPLNIENAGKGVATTLTIGFNKLDLPEHEYKFIEPINLACNDKLYLQIFCADVKDERNRGEYHLDFRYHDIYQTQYRQRYKCEITGERASISLVGEQEIL